MVICDVVPKPSVQFTVLCIAVNPPKAENIHKNDKQRTNKFFVFLNFIFKTVDILSYHKSQIIHFKYYIVFALCYISLWANSSRLFPRTYCFRYSS